MPSQGMSWYGLDDWGMVMPRITVKVGGTYEAIVRPVATGILRDVMVATGMDERHTSSTLFGEFGVREQLGSKMGETGEVSFGSESRVNVTLEDNVKYEHILSTHVRDKEHPPILADRRLGIGVYPVYLDSEITLNFQYTAENKEEALKWRDDFKIKRAEERTVLYHEIHYHVPMQDGIFKLLHHLHELREKTSGYGDTFSEYIESIQQRELTTLTGVDGNVTKGALAVPEKQIQVTGWFDFNEPPRQEKEQGGTRWVIEFSYKCMYKRFSHFYLVYPLAVHQTHIARRYFQQRKVYSYEEMSKNSGIRVLADQQMEANRLPHDHMIETDGLRFPEWDDWIPQLVSGVDARRIKPMMTWLIGANPEEPTRLFDFKTMPELRLSLEIEGFMRAVHEKLTTRRRSIIYVQLYKGDTPVTDSAIYVDEDLVLRSHRGLDLRHLYHVRFSLVISDRGLLPEALDDLRHHPDAAYSIIKTLFPELDDQYFLDNLVSDRVIRRGYLEEILRGIEHRNTPVTQGPQNPWWGGGNGPYPGGKGGEGGGRDHWGPGAIYPGGPHGPWSSNMRMKTVQHLLIVTKR